MQNMVLRLLYLFAAARATEIEFKDGETCCIAIYRIYRIYIIDGKKILV